MGIAETLAKVTDPYERQARLWPALLAGLPLFVLISLIYIPAAGISEKVAIIAASCGGLYMLTSISRELGKRLESRLFESWGGKPTTQLLRHRDATLEGVTKRRYHAFLAKAIGVSFPDATGETTDPKGADDTYQSGVRWLLNHTRDRPQFGLLFDENIAYGFRRNALGLKPIALIIAAATLTWVLVTHNVLTVAAANFVSMEALAALPVAAHLSGGLSIVMFAIWILFFTTTSVRTAAFTYAETLLRACDTLK